jgi:hypothetical protein
MKGKNMPLNRNALQALMQNPQALQALMGQMVGANPLAPRNGGAVTNRQAQPFNLESIENELRKRARAEADATGDDTVIGFIENAIGLNRQWMGAVAGGMMNQQMQIDELRAQINGGGGAVVEIIEVIDHRPNGRQLPNVGRRN